ncbi:putative short-chain dehydrogenase/reductase [Viridothelium virens]|uniref:Putative short-chain dehydrogenase/reductase n=1 Tax=Viridothelium virens TaxID=1048519 RepID=A0A6A6HC06_VIRVR|nr:putative short-chain dehydrogenase/reductase [Viridothelium virens]
MAKTEKNVLVTGCSTGGLGCALAKTFRDQGFHVLATVRDTHKAGALAAEEGIEVLILDVASSKSIESCLTQVRNITGSKLDVLVNNAGVVIYGPLIHASIEEGKAAYDVNVWGPLAVTQSFAPLLINSKGVVLNISSIAGAVPLAWQGLYNSSKAAMTFISETLKLELAPLGVRVVTAMVGAMGTQLNDNREVSLPPGSYYKPVEETIKKQSRGEMQESLNEPVDVTARSLVKDTLVGRRGQVWRGGEAGRASILSWLIPTALRERILHTERGIYQLKYDG